MFSSPRENIILRGKSIFIPFKVFYVNCLCLFINVIYNPLSFTYILSPITCLLPPTLCSFITYPPSPINHPSICPSLSTEAEGLGNLSASRGLVCFTQQRPKERRIQGCLLESRIEQMWEMPVTRMENSRTGALGAGW